MIKAGDITRKERRHLAWSLPDEGWMMINTDGSVNAEEGKAAGGGLLRDHLGRCHEAFSMNLGNCTITRAELKGAETGVATTWRKGYRKIKLCMDSTTAISIIKNRDDD
ncbi:unnamed protein product [Linum trigynum]|uniref:RNase H type-1 domain-containing protein n=1 Tax=Linum trigynum TaxID=586398 RepID=A0AAV2CK16_9ROSI